MSDTEEPGAVHLAFLADGRQPPPDAWGQVPRASSAWALTQSSLVSTIGSANAIPT